MQAIPEDDEGVGGRVLDDGVSESVEFVGVRGRLAVEIQPAGNPIIHSTKHGLRCPGPGPELAADVDDGSESLSSSRAETVVRPGTSIPRTATSVRVAPLWRPLSDVRLPAVPPARASCAVGVGRTPRCCSLAISVGSWPASPGPL